MKELTPRRQIVMVMGALTAASAYLAFPLMSVTPSAHECIAADRMPLSRLHCRGSRPSTS